MKVTISTRDDSAASRARLLSALRDPVSLHRAAAEGALPLFQRQLLTNARTNRNRFGAGSTFWQRMNAGTRAGADSAHGFVAMPREMRLRVRGGVVKPRNGSRYLTIPLRSESYGRSIRQFPKVFFVRRGGRLFACAKLGDKAITILYLLTKSVTIRGDAGLLPNEDAVQAAAVRGVKGFVRRNG